MLSDQYHWLKLALLGAISGDFGNNTDYVEHNRWNA
jgi:hypothetical protein